MIIIGLGVTYLRQEFRWKQFFSDEDNIHIGSHLGVEASKCALINCKMTHSKFGNICTEITIDDRTRDTLPSVTFGHTNAWTFSAADRLELGQRHTQRPNDMFSQSVPGSTDDILHLS